MKYQQFAPKMLNLDLIEKNQSVKNLQDCHICSCKNTREYQSKLIHSKYFDTFNFYFAKPINEILGNVKIDHVILFKDFLFYNDDNEYLKRYYKVDEVDPRMQILSEFYTNQYKETRPNLCIVRQGKVIHKRNQKQAKIYLSRFQKKDSISNNAIMIKKMLPDHIFSRDCTISPTENSESVYHKQQISWDSQSHNIYDVTQSLSVKKLKADTINLHTLILLQNGDSIKLFLKENDRDFTDAIDGINLFAKSLIKKQAALGHSDNNIEPVTMFNKPKLQPAISEIEFLSNYATNDPYASERSNIEKQVEYKSPKLLKAKVPNLNLQIKNEKIDKPIQNQQVNQSSRKHDSNYLKSIFMQKGKPLVVQDNRISNQVLRKVYEQHIDKISLKPKKQLVIKSEHSQSPEKQKKSVKLRDSQSSETSTSHLKSQKVNHQNKFQDFRSSSSKHKVYLKQSANNPALLKKANFSKLTYTSPSMTQLFKKRANYNQTSTINNSLHQTSQKNLHKHIEYSKIEQPTLKMKNTNCSPSMLLRSLSSNPSMTQSPARRIEIKVNLNKLIQQQEEEMQDKIEGFWTQRGPHGELEDTIKGTQTERNAYKFFQKKTLNQLYVKLSPSQKIMLKQKIKPPAVKSMIQKRVM